MELEEIKRELKTMYDKYDGNFQECRSEYIEQYYHCLEEHYETEQYPDNIEMRYEAVMERFSPDELVLSLKFLIGDFELGYSSLLRYTYERKVDNEAGLFLHSRLQAIGILNQPEPVKVDNMIYKLFPELGRKSI